MAITDAELDYQHHLGFFKDLGHLTGDAKRDEFWHRKAEYMHSLCVCDAIRDTQLDAVILSQRIANPEAIVQQRFGVARRTKFIWFSLRGLLALVHPERTEPLPLDDVEEVARDLNVIYINIRGTLDNFAWSILNMFGGDKSRNLSPTRVHLFGHEFLKDSNLKEVAEFVGSFSQWNRELKERRDPAAHRIPLSVPPAAPNEAAQKEYARISGEYAEAFNNAVKAVGVGADRDALFEKANMLHGNLERIGTFMPIFVHHPNDEPMKIYPTVPQDIGQLVKIARGLSKIIADKTADSKQT